MSADQTINANLAQCIQKMTHVGFTRVHNVCSGSVTDVPWGLGDWVLIVGLGSLFALFLLAMTAIIFSMAAMMWQDLR